MRRWRLYLWPSIAFAIGVLLWPVSVFYTNSTLHMLAHASWAEVAMLAGAIQLALVRGKLTSRWWTLSLCVTLLVSSAAFLIHEQNPWFFSRAAFLHHAIGWTLLVAAIFPLGQALQPRRFAWSAGFAMTWIVVAVMLFCDRDVAPIFGHLSKFAGGAAMRARPRRCRRRADVPGGRLRSRDPHVRLAGDAVAPRQAPDRRRDALRPDGHDHVARDRGVHRRRAQGLRPGRVDRRRPRRPGAALRAPPGRGVHGALARDLRRRSHGLGRLHVRHRRHAAAPDRGLRLHRAGVGR